MAQRPGGVGAGEVEELRRLRFVFSEFLRAENEKDRADRAWVRAC